jgi:hypothetical protein
MQYPRRKTELVIVRSEKQTKLIMRERTVKHHYLPRHYLKGFTADNGSFWVYDKQRDKMFESNPGATFFENDLNTMVSPQGTASDFLEELYTAMENQVWESFNKIKDSTSKTPIELWDKMYLYFFLLFLHWRLPSNIAYAEQLSEEAFSEDTNDLSFMVIRDRTGREVPSPIIEEIKRSDGFKKTMRVIAPFVPFLGTNTG